MFLKPVLRRLSAAFVAFLTMLTLVTVAFASPASAAKDKTSKPVLMDDDLAAITIGANSWVNLLWAADGDIDDFKLTATAKDGVELAYSETTVDHAGPMNGYGMNDHAIDFTALKVSVPDGYSGKDLKVKLHATWTADGRTHDNVYNVKIPVIEHTGDDWQQVDTTGSVHNGTDTGWVELRVAGLAPQSNNFQMFVDDHAGADPYLPQETWTGPDHDALVEAGETDTVRFYVEPGSVPAGTYEMSFMVSWTAGSESKTKIIPFTLEIS